MEKDFEIRFAGKVNRISLDKGDKQITFSDLALLRDLDKLHELLNSSHVEITIKPIKRAGEA
ncbi:hypothetical protein P59_207 [Bacillus phage P59]|nr:hypothetical protein P59_207 [Bacillus phage P59]